MLGGRLATPGYAKFTIGYTAYIVPLLRSFLNNNLKNWVVVRIILFPFYAIKPNLIALDVCKNSVGVHLQSSFTIGEQN
jgi:hypothetical protein